MWAEIPMLRWRSRLFMEINLRSKHPNRATFP
jgi:hypothetical protein